MVDKKVLEKEKVFKEEESEFEKLSKVECKTEKKGQFNYVSWTDAWTEFKKFYPGASYKIYENEQGFPCFINETGGMVKVGVKAKNIEYINWMPVLNFSNKSVPKAEINTFDINKAIQRGFVKAMAMHGLGLYVYRGEDLPTQEDVQKAGNQTIPPVKAETPAKMEESARCSVCNQPVVKVVKEFSEKNYNGKILCRNCQGKQK